MTDGGRRGEARPRVDPVLLALLFLGGAFLARYLLRGWFPHDEGALGQSAERVLRGEVPHRDFDEIYTGLLSYLHAGVFALVGIGSVALRIPLFVAAVGWLAAMYRILRRFAPPLGAGLAALTAFVWSVPNYPASLPSWYILFCATFAALAMLRGQEGGDRRWFALAGALAGIAFLFKLSGIFVLLGGGLALLVAEEPAGSVDAAGGMRTARGPYEWAIGLLLVLMVLALGAVAGRTSDRELLRIVFPTSLLALAIAARIGTPPFAPSRERWRALLARMSPFKLGAVLPIGAFLLFYLLVGGTGQMLEGVFVTPFRRVAFASVSPPPPVTLLLAVPLAAFLWLRSSQGVLQKVVPVAAVLWFGAALVLSGADPRWYRVGWFSAWGLLFVVAIEGARAILGPSATSARAAATLCCFAVGLSLIEYPFAAPIYTLYALPLTMVAAVAAVRASGRPGVAVQLAVVGFFLAFGLWRVVPGSVGSLGRGFMRTPDVARLDLPRGGLRIDPREAVLYEQLIPFVVAQADGRAIWAGPDAPEVYFLSGLPNHTRTLFDFLDSPATTAVPLVDRLTSLNVSVVVLKLNSQFSRAPSPESFAALRAAFPNERTFLGFVVLWR